MPTDTPIALNVPANFKLFSLELLLQRGNFTQTAEKRRIAMSKPPQRQTAIGFTSD